MLVIDNNGEILEPIAYMTYLPQFGDYGKFYDAGYKIFSFSVFTGDCPTNEEAGMVRGFGQNVWVSENEFNFEVVEDTFKRIEKQCGTKDFQILFRFNLNMPRWWRKKYPEELTLFSDGKKLMQSVFSLQWRKDIKVYLEKFNEYIINSEYKDCVLGWQVAGMHTEEWMAPFFGNGSVNDYSIPALTAFRKYLKKKYKDIESLNCAWAKDFTSFEQVEIPSCEDRKEWFSDGKSDEFRTAIRDYMVFFNNGYADVIEYFCKTVKEITNNEVLVGAFYGYIGQLNCSFGHCAFNRVLNSKYVDFFASPFTYNDSRGKGVDWYYHSALASVDKQNKLWFIEADVRTNRAKALYNVVPEAFDGEKPVYYRNPVWFGPKSKKDCVSNLTRIFAKMFISRIAFWWFDMWGGWYNDKKYLRLMKAMCELYKREVNTEIESAAEIALVLDENSSYYRNGEQLRAGTLGQIAVLSLSGAPYELHLLDKFTYEDAKKYKLILFGCPINFTNTQLKFIDKLRKEGKVVYALSDVENKYEFGLPKEIELEQIQEVFDKAGVHSYSFNNVVYANKKYVSVTAHEDGEVVLTMPFDCELKLFNSKKTYKTKDKKVVFKLKKNDTKFLEIIK